MSLLVVGSVAFDSVETPFGKADRVLGGSATFFAYAASYFVGPRLMGIVGADFPEKFLQGFRDRDIDISGLQVDPEGKTFHWTGRYEGDMNEAQTLGVSLNVLGDYEASVPDSYKDSEYVFLANDHPRTQLQVMRSVSGKPFVMADTRDFWISEEPDALGEVMSEVDGMVMNDSEARLLTGEESIIRAGKAVMERGPRYVIIKKGEHGAILFGNEGIFALPAYPLEEVHDPTGAGDSFAGGLMGYLASTGKTSLQGIMRGMTYGTVAASVAVEGFSVDPFAHCDKDRFHERHDAFIRAISF